MASDPAHLTIQQYLAWELSQEVRHEYVHGLVLAMSGASRAHGTIVMNFAAMLRPRLRGTGCDAFASDMKLLVEAKGTVRYPDLLVTCDERDRADPYVTRHPKLIVEVLSASTERDDRSVKLLEYRTIDTLEEYLLVDSRRTSVELQRRGPAQTWITFEFGRDDVVRLTTLDIELPVSEIYEGVDFERIAVER